MIITTSATPRMPSDGLAAARIRLWSLREDVLVEGDPERRRLVVVTRFGETRIEDPSGPVLEALRRMSLGPICMENVLPQERSAATAVGFAEPGDGVGGWRAGEKLRGPEWGRLRRVLDLLGDSVVHSLGLTDAEGPLLSAVPVARDASFDLRPVDPGMPVRLSRFAAIRSHQGELLVESPLSPYQVLLHRQLARRVTSALCGTAPVAELARVLDVPQPLVADLVAYLVAAGVVRVGEHRGDDPRAAWFAEDHDPSLARWSHHDLMFHSRSRMGRHDGPTGAAFPSAGPPPVRPAAARPAPAVPRYALPRPEETPGGPVEPPRPRAAGSGRPLTADQLGELLFRAARIGSGHDLDELGLYVALYRCAGLPRGIFEYDPREHVLKLINRSATELEDLLDLASVAIGTTRRPPALITITARANRSSWPHPGIAYALALTNAGALQQSLYLAANVMGLAACVPPVEPGGVTDRALRLDWPAEVGVGEFVVGCRRIPNPRHDV